MVRSELVCEHDYVKTVMSTTRRAANHRGRRLGLTQPEICRARCSALGWWNIGIQAEQIGLVIYAFNRTEALIVGAERSTDFFRLIVCSNVVDIGAGLQMGLQPPPKFAHPRNMPATFRPVRPLADGIKVPLRATRAECRLRFRDTCNGTMKIKQEQCAQRRAEARGAINHHFDQLVRNLPTEG